MWRDRPHPRWKDRRQAFDWGSARALYDPASGVSWTAVSAVLLRIEAGARKAQAELDADAEGTDA